MDSNSIRIRNSGSSKIIVIICLCLLKTIHVLSQHQVLSPKRSMDSSQVSSCKIPKLEGNLYSCPHHNSEHCDIESGSSVPGNGTIVKLQCSSDFVLSNEEVDFTVCFDGVWYPKIQPCLKTCGFLDTLTISANCSYNGEKSSCYDKIKVGTEVSWKCIPGYQTDNRNQVNTCMKTGRWKFPPDTVCTPEFQPAKVAFRPTSINPVGMPHDLYCTVVAGYPPPNLTWYKNGEPIKRESRVNFTDRLRIEFRESILHIQETFFSDSGIYSCKAENFNSSDTVSAVLAFIGRVSIDKSIDRTFMVPAGNAVVIPCNVSTPQLPIMVTWYKFDKELHSRNKGDRIFIEELKCDKNATSTCQGSSCSESITCVSLLVIRRITLADNGVYTCRARNEISFDVSPMTLTVLDLCRNPIDCPVSIPKDYAGYRLITVTIKGSELKIKAELPLQ